MSRVARSEASSTTITWLLTEGQLQQLLNWRTNEMRDKKRCRTKLSWSTKTTKASWIWCWTPNVLVVKTEDWITQTPKSATKGQVHDVVIAVDVLKSRFHLENRPEISLTCLHPSPVWLCCVESSCNSYRGHDDSTSGLSVVIVVLKWHSKRPLLHDRICCMRHWPTSYNC